MSATVRHCSSCGETTHTRPTCPRIKAWAAARAVKAAEERQRQADAERAALEAERVAKEAERADFAAQPTQKQLLTLYDAMKALELTMSELKETCQLQKEEIASLERRFGEID